LPGRAFGLHGQQLGDGVAPALGSAAPVGRWAIADPGRRGLGFEACAVAGLVPGRLTRGSAPLRACSPWGGRPRGMIVLRDVT
jgi:hypothetical protein